MWDEIKFKKVVITDPETNKRQDAVAVIRNGSQVALLPEADRLRRALSLSVEGIRDILNNFRVIMGREPNRDESEFWKAVLDFKQG